MSKYIVILKILVIFSQRKITYIHITKHLFFTQDGVKTFSG